MKIEIEKLERLYPGYVTVYLEDFKFEGTIAEFEVVVEDLNLKE